MSVEIIGVCTDDPAGNSVFVEVAADLEIHTIDQVITAARLAAGHSEESAAWRDPETPFEFRHIGMTAPGGVA